MFPAGEALELARIVLAGLTPTPEDRTADPMTALEQSALEEIANVAVSAVLNQLGDHLGEAIHPHAPVFVFDMAGAMLDEIVSDAMGDDDTIFAARTKFSRDGREANGVLLVVPAG